MRKQKSNERVTQKPRDEGTPATRTTTKLPEKPTREQTITQSGRTEVPIANNLQELCDLWDSEEFRPTDFEIPVDVKSLESSVGYSSLIRQFHRAYRSRVAFFRSADGGALPIEEARRRAFHSRVDKDEALKEFSRMMSIPVDQLNFCDLCELFAAAPRVAERFWEMVKREGRKEFESGHLAANISFPAGYMKQVWNIGRYMGVRESFIAEWKPKGGIEAAMIDMLAQSYFQWQYWLEQTVKRSEVPEKEEHPEYVRWKRDRSKYGEKSPYDVRWIRPFVSDVVAVEHAVQMADRFNRIFMRTLRQLRDLRRYSSVTINNANQVNIAADGGKQSNISKRSSKSGGR